MPDFKTEQQERAKHSFEAIKEQMLKDYLSDRSEDTTEKWEIKDRAIDALSWTGKDWTCRGSVPVRCSC